MAADKSLVQGAYRAAMANVTKDQSKFFEAVLGFGDAVAKKAIEIDAGPPKDEALEKASQAFREQSVINGKGEAYQEAATTYLKSQADAFYATDDEMEKARIKQNILTSTSNMDTAVSVQEKLSSSNAFNELDVSDFVKKRWVAGDFKNSTYDHEKGDIVFPDGERINAKVLQEQVQPSKSNQHYKNVGELKEIIEKNAVKGGKYDSAENERYLKRSVLSSNLDIQNFAAGDNFKNSDGSFSDFRTVLLKNPDVAEFINISVEDNPEFKSFDVTGNDGKVNQADLDTMLKEMKGDQKKKMTNEFLDILLNDKNPGYKKDVTQNVIAKTLSESLRQSSHNPGNTAYTKSLNTPSSTTSGTLSERREQNALKSFTSQVKDLVNENNGRKRIELGDEGVLFINKNGKDYTLTREYYEGDAKQTSIEDLSIDQAFVKMSKSGLLAKNELSDVYSLFKSTEERYNQGGAFAVDIMAKDDTDVKSDILAKYSGVKVNKNISGVSDAGVEVIEVVTENGARQVVYLQGENSTDKEKELKKLNNFLEKNAKKIANTQYNSSK